jgi:hypothetical protein
VGGVGEPGDVADVGHGAGWIVEELLGGGDADGADDLAE